MNVLNKYSRWIIAGVLLIAGVFKIIDPENLVEVILFFGFQNEIAAFLFVYTVSAIEIILAYLLIRKTQSLIPEMSVFILCFIFLSISLIGYLNEWQFACGCLGRFSFGKFDISMVARNSILMIMASFIVVSTYTKSQHELNN